jgi:hypothetical protein
MAKSKKPQTRKSKRKTKSKAKVKVLDMYNRANVQPANEAKRTRWACVENLASWDIYIRTNHTKGYTFNAIIPEEIFLEALEDLTSGENPELVCPSNYLTLSLLIILFFPDQSPKHDTTCRSPTEHQSTSNVKPYRVFEPQRRKKSKARIPPSEGGA